MKNLEVVCGVSARHLHLSQKDLITLFGEDACLNSFKALGQPGQYACEEKVNFVGPKNTIKNVRVLGPLRKQTQIEISLTDCFTLGIQAPVRDSGNLSGSAAILLEGPKGSVALTEGVIVAMRHVHFHPDDAAPYGIKDKDIISVRTRGNSRSLIFENVLARVAPNFALEFHVDTDEANAAGLKNGDIAEILK
ncbi:MAG: phosphate propanoyltransferase [Negativicutes bacterium]|nr:phosphate propanoyltransferase [Negativicutes bacterium]